MSEHYLYIQNQQLKREENNALTSEKDHIRQQKFIGISFGDLNLEFFVSRNKVNYFSVMVEDYLFCHKTFSHIDDNDVLSLFYSAYIQSEIKKGERHNI